MYRNSSSYEVNKVREELTPSPLNVRSVYDQVAQNYDSFYGDERCLEENAEVMSYMQKSFFSYKEGTNRVDGNILDIGSGTGLLLDHLSGSIVHPYYIGVDVSWEMVKVSQQKHPSYDFINCDVRQMMGFGNYDYVVALFGSLSYVPLGDAFDILTRTLSPEGRFMVMLYANGHSSRILHDQVVNDITFPVTEAEVATEVHNLGDRLTIQDIFLFGKMKEHLIIKGIK